MQNWNWTWSHEIKSKIERAFRKAPTNAGKTRRSKVSACVYLENKRRASVTGEPCGSPPSSSSPVVTTTPLRPLCCRSLQRRGGGGGGGSGIRVHERSFEVGRLHAFSSPGCFHLQWWRRLNTTVFRANVLFLLLGVLVHWKVLSRMGKIGKGFWIL